MHLGLGNSQKAKRFRKFVTRSSTKFDGTDGYVQSALPTVFNAIGSNDFSVSLWFNSDDLAQKAVYTRFFEAAYDFNNFAQFNIAEAGKPRFNVFDGGTHYASAVNSALNTGQWYHMVGVWDASENTAKLYLDGVLQSGGNGGNLDAGWGGVQNAFLACRGGASGFMDGSLDEVAIFSSALTAREVDALYNNGQPTKIRTNPNLANWFRMGEGKLGPKSDGDSNILFQGLPTTFGSELITNGDFSSASGWTADSNAAITGGKLVLTGSSGLSYQTIDLEDGHAYEVSFTVENLTSGTVKPYLNGTNGTVRSANGTYTEVLIAGSSNTLVGINPSGTMDIDNFSLKKLTNVGTLVNSPEIQADGGSELIVNGTFDSNVTSWPASSGGTVTWSNGTAITGAVGTDDRGGMSQTFTTVNGRNYTLSFDVISRTSTKWEVYRQGSGGPGTIIEGTDLGSHKITFTAASNSTELAFYAKQAGTSDGTVAWDNISVKEVTESVPKQCKNLPSAGSAKSLSCDGTDDYVDCGTGLGDALGDNYAGSLTVSIWFKADTTSGNDGLFNIGDFSNSQGEFQISLQGNNIYYTLNNNGFVRNFSFTDTDNWNHIVVVYVVGDATNSKVYMNGSEQATSQSGSLPSSTDLDFAGLKTIIGAYYATNHPFHGSIDEVAIWDTALDGDAIKALYNAGEPTPVTTKTGAYDIYRDNLKAYYKMGDATNPAADGTSSRVDSHLFDQTNPGLGAELSVADPFTSGRWGGVGTNTPTFVAGESVRIDRPATGGNASGGYVYLNDTSIGFLTEDVVATKVYKLTLLFETDDSNAHVRVTGGGGHHDSSAGSGVKTFYLFGFNTGGYITFVGLDNGKFLKVSQLSLKEVNGHTGVINNATIQTEAPKAIYALPPVDNTKSIILEGDDEFLQTQVDSAAQPNNESRYYSWWSKATRTTHNPVFDHGNAQKGAFHFNQSAGRPLLWMGNTVYKYWNDNSAQDSGEWAHWVLRISTNAINDCQLWCNGVELTNASTVNTGLMNTYDTGIRIGRGGGTYFEGSLDEFSIHEELDEEAIRALFNRGRPIDISSSNGAYDLSDKALHWWRMGDATSPAADGTNDIIFQGLEAEGSEEVTNGDFSNGATGWTPAGSLQASASDGALLLTHPDAGTWYGNYLPFTSSNLVAGRTYKVTFDAQYVSGTQTLRLAYNSTEVLNLTSANYDSTFRTYEAVFTATFAGSFRVFINGGTGSFKIDNVSVKQLRGQYLGKELVTNGDFSSGTNGADNWTTGAGFTISGGKATRVIGQNSDLSQTLSTALISGSLYKISFNAEDTSGNTTFAVRLKTPGEVESSFETRGASNAIFLTASNAHTILDIRPGGSATGGAVSNISVKEVGGAAVMTNMTTSDIQTDTPY